MPVSPAAAVRAFRPGASGASCTTEPDWARARVPGLQRRRDGAGGLQRPGDRSRPARISCLKGMAIAAYAVGAAMAYRLPPRRVQVPAAHLLRARSRRRGPPAIFGDNIMGSGFDLDLRLHVSAGRYICGEASAMLNALEGERPVPRHKPPHQTGSGLWSKPTVVNNVETLASCRAIDHQRGRLVPRPGPVRRRRNEGLHGQREGQTSGSVGTSHGRPIRELIEELCGRHALWLILGGGPSRRSFDSVSCSRRILTPPWMTPPLRRVGSRLGTGTGHRAR